MREKAITLIEKNMDLFGCLEIALRSESLMSSGIHTKILFLLNVLFSVGYSRAAQSFF